MFEAIETSRALGEPVELFQFVYGPNDESYCYTDAEEAVTLVGAGPGGSDLVFAPFPIMREAITSSGTLDRAALAITTAIDAEVVELFRVYPPMRPVVVIIRQGHLNDPEEQFLVVWSGRVLSCKRGDQSDAELTCEPVQTSMKRAALRRHYQYGCPLALYQGVEGKVGCHASKAAATESGTVAAIAGTSVTLEAGWNGARDPAKFLGGLCEWDSSSGGREMRTILRVTGDVLLLSGIVRDLEVGGDVDVVLGCNHQMSDCKDLHNVLPDFGGQPWIPGKNPFGNTNNFY